MPSRATRRVLVPSMLAGLLALGLAHLVTGPPAHAAPGPGAAAVHEPPPTLVYPVDLVLDADGSLVIADFKAHGLLRSTPAGEVSPILQGEGLPKTPLYGTRAVVAAPDGDGWLVADPGTFGLYRVAADGELSTITTELDIPMGLAPFDDGSVLVSDLRSGIGAIMRVTLDGEVTVFAETGSPTGIVPDGDEGFVFVSRGERALLRAGRDGAVTTIASGPPFDFPHDVVVDDDGYVVTDGYASALLRVTRDGEVSVLAQGDPLVNPQGIAAAPDGGYYVVDPQARRVFRVSDAGEVTTLLEVTGDAGEDAPQTP